MRASIELKERELHVFDKAIEDIEHEYGHILFTPDFFAGATRDS